MDKVRWLGITCPLCGQELNSWDVRCSKAVGLLVLRQAKPGLAADSS